MKQFILLFVFLGLAVYSLKLAYTNSDVYPENITVEVQCKVTLDDEFQLFYQQKGDPYFSEEKSVRVPVIGKNEFQTLNFEIPIQKEIQSIRLDIGQNIAQKPVEITRIDLTALSKRYTIEPSHSFVTNECVQTKSNIYSPIEVNGKYDPILVSTFDFVSFQQRLQGPQKDNRRLYLLVLLNLIVLLVLLRFRNEITFKFFQNNARLALFILVIISPLYVNLIGIELNPKLSENRTKAAFPELKLTENFSSKFESYFNDNYPLRSYFIQANSWIKTKLFKVSPNPQLAVFGKNNFMYYSRQDDAIYNSYSHKDTLSDLHLLWALNHQKEIKDTLNAKGIEYVVCFFPNKHTIYPEYTPRRMQMQIGEDASLADQITTYFKTNNFDIVDVREQLLKKKKKDQLYLKYDTHWNNKGAFYAYQELFNQLYPKLQIKPYELDEFNLTLHPVDNGDLSHMMGINQMEIPDMAPVFEFKHQEKSYITENTNLPNTIITINDYCGNDKTLVVYRDSYTTALIPYISLHFKKVIYIKNYKVDFEAVEQHDPDVVMWLRVERYLSNLLIN